MLCRYIQQNNNLTFNQKIIQNNSCKNKVYNPMEMYCEECKKLSENIEEKDEKQNIEEKDEKQNIEENMMCAGRNLQGIRCNKERDDKNYIFCKDCRKLSNQIKQNRINKISKRCSRCHIVKSFSDFHKDKNRWDEVVSSCKKCLKKKKKYIEKVIEI